jgi:hypothetical protein
VLNPLVIPFGLIYFCAAYRTFQTNFFRRPCITDIVSSSFLTPAAVFKNQLLHVYQHQYETQGTRVTIRFLRYTLDGHCREFDIPKHLTNWGS